MTDLFWDVHHATAADEPLPIERQRADGAVRELEDRVNRLAMICCAMWTIVQAQCGSSDEELERLVRELDLMDGQLDGKAAVPQVRDCVQCGRPVAVRHLRCIYCGAPRPNDTPFDSVL